MADRTSPPTPRYVHDFVEHCTCEGERLLHGGAEPATPATQLVAAYPALRGFLYAHADVLSARGVVSAEIEAGQVLVERVAVLLQQGESAPTGSGDDVRARGAAKLRQLHDALRKLLRSPESAPLRERLGIDRPVRAHSLTAVLRGIDQLLAALQDAPEQLRALRLIPADLEQLAGLRQQLAELRRTPATAVEPVVMKRACLILDVFYASMAAGISAGFLAEDPRRAAGLSLIPPLAERDRTRPPIKPWRTGYPSADE